LKNTGKNLENWILAEAGKYERKGKLILRKVDPPSFTRLIKGRAIHTLLSNPFPDFIGCTKRGTTVCIEAKSTKEKRLAFGKSGIRQKQIDDLNAFRKFGAICGIIWDCGKFYWVTLDDIKKAESDGRKSITPDYCSEIKSENGHVIDFFTNLSHNMDFSEWQEGGSSRF
jgi:penicillin-binding protein-related factor A (putative recombinase)